MGEERTGSARERHGARRVPGPIAATGMIVVILLTAALAWFLHGWNLRARQRARQAAEAAEEAAGSRP